MPGLAGSFLGKAFRCQFMSISAGSVRKGQVPYLGFPTLLFGVTPNLVCPPGSVHSLSVLGVGPSIKGSLDQSELQS